MRLAKGSAILKVGNITILKKKNLKMYISLLGLRKQYTIDWVP